MTPLLAVVLIFVVVFSLIYLVHQYIEWSLADDYGQMSDEWTPPKEQR